MAVRTSQAERWAVLAVCAALPVYLAMRDGTYDIIARQQVGLVIWWGLALAFAFDLLPRAVPARAARLPLLAAAGLVAWTALSLVWTESDEQTFAELARTIDYAGLLVLVLSMVNSNTWRSAAAGLSMGALVVPAIAVASRIDPAAFPPEAILRGFHGDRLSWPLGYWNAIGAWGAIAIAIGIAWSAHLRPGLMRFLSLAAVPVAGTAVYLSYSRGGVAGSILAVLLVIALGRHRWTTIVHAVAAGIATGATVLAIRAEPAIAHGTSGAGGEVVGAVLIAMAAVCGFVAIQTARRGIDRRELALPGGRVVLAACVCAALAGAAIVGPSTASRAGSEFASGAIPGGGADPAARFVTLGGSRYDIWSSAFRAFGSDPLTGIGPGTFQFWWTRDVPGGEQLLDAHSLPIETLAELGIPGLILLAGSIVGLLGFGLRARSSIHRSAEVGAWAALVGAFAVYLLAASVDWMWELTAVTALGLAAVAIAGAATSKPAARQRLGARRVWIVVLALLAGAAQVPGIVSTARFRDSQDALFIGFLPDAQRWADDAVTGEPWAASPYAQRALVEVAQGKLADARADAETAISHEPNNWAHHLVLARIEALAGNRQAALAELAEVVRLRPAAARGIKGIENAVRRAGGEPIPLR